MEHLKIALLFLAIISAPVSAEKYLYVSGVIGDKEFYQMDSEAQTINFGGDSKSAADFCDGKEFHCFISLRLSFSVPTSSIPRKWSYRGIHFSSSECNEVLVALGRKYSDICVIEGPMGSRETNKKMLWYYSIKDGLIAFRAVNQTELRSVWDMHFLAGTSGFGASKKDL
ncbi:hypothetical protein [Pseudoalteromonas sp. MMG024]|uniref:hypothetical protein n=1 Tax=Pseudoalteromonas sp. MMG024 TaxID=2909980 RepID=UPI001F3F06FF|nr:hypothetical protein [Pseudoalteromonas sp. MMG024]MCF6457333.1 hypothetical protein [Pseudoalteromonas sp. MMG024]